MTRVPGRGETAEPASSEDLDRYRPNVGLVLANSEGKVWLGRRSGTPAPQNWQFPQGGVDKGEDLLDAALRELREETGAVTVSVLGRTSEWMAYAFPPSYRRGPGLDRWLGQKQIWFALLFAGDDSEFDLGAHGTPEFDAWRWAELDEVVDLVIGFKRPIYERVVAAFRPLIAPQSVPS